MDFESHYTSYSLSIKDFSNLLNLNEIALFEIFRDSLRLEESPSPSQLPSAMREMLMRL